MVSYWRIYGGLMQEKQVKSKQRVADHGEVFTNEREVKAMCDLVKQETERIDSRFLEPACGEGAFLTEILSRKLAVVKRKYWKNLVEFERYAVLAVSSLYGVDILADNTLICRAKLFKVWDEVYTAVAGARASEECRKAVQFILSKNILCGDALTLKQADGSPIIFAQWSLVLGDQMKRRDFALDELLSKSEKQIERSLPGWEYDEEIKAMLPSPVREHPLTDFRRLADEAQ